MNSFLYWLLDRLSLPIDVYAYVNPLVVVGALSLLVTFYRIPLGHSKIINWIASSSFAAFLLHSNPNIAFPIFKKTVTELYQSYFGIECIGMILGFLIIVFACAVILDQPRKWLWKVISKHL